jgi:hypothetical protein
MGVREALTIAMSPGFNMGILGLTEACELHGQTSQFSSENIGQQGKGSESRLSILDCQFRTTINNRQS